MTFRIQMRPAWRTADCRVRVGRARARDASEFARPWPRTRAHSDAAAAASHSTTISIAHAHSAYSALCKTHTAVASDVSQTLAALARRNAIECEYKWECEAEFRKCEGEPGQSCTAIFKPVITVRRAAPSPCCQNDCIRQ